MTDREKKFQDLAEKRVNNAIKQIRLIGNLSNKSNYSYNDKQVKKIVSALSLELNQLKVRFKIGMEKDGKKFKI